MARGFGEKVKQYINKMFLFGCFMKFRKARRDDTPKMFEIIKINSPMYPRKIVLQELNEMFSDSLIKPIYILAEERGEILAFGGFIYSWVDNNVFNIFWVNVDSKHQGRGIGSKLMKEIIRRIKKAKNPEAKLITLSCKLPNFYEKLGFKKMGEKYDRNYVLMSLKI